MAKGNSKGKASAKGNTNVKGPLKSKNKGCQGKNSGTKGKVKSVAETLPVLPVFGPPNLPPKKFVLIPPPSDPKIAPKPRRLDTLRDAK